MDEDKITYYKYGMRLRGFSPGAQPMQGLVGVESGRDRYHDILIYSRPLNDHEQEGYELDYLGEVER